MLNANNDVENHQDPLQIIKHYLANYCFNH